MKELHTFVVCAYKESAFLEECVRSLTEQTVKTNIIIATSTPNATINAVAEKYGLEVKVNTGEAGITGDWNFGLSLANTPLVTIAHQDDVYEPTYTEEVLTRLSHARRPILAFTDYFEIRRGERVYQNRLLRVKRFLALPIRLFPHSRFARRRALSLGNCICCPAVTYAREAFGDMAFDPAYAFVCDWDATERLSRLRGSFFFIRRPLMGHRIHEDSETSRLSASKRREEEEKELLGRFWPRPIARLLFRFYRHGADSNELTKDK